MTIPDPSLVLSGGFLLLLAATLVAAIVIARRYTTRPLGRIGACIALWIVLSGGLAASGLMHRWDLRPPPGFVLFVTGFVLTLVLSRRPAIREIAAQAPISVLIGFQAFRFPLELLLHRAYGEGVMPIQMSYSGRNFDIVTGLLAIGLGLWGTRGQIPRACAQAFNVVGLVLLANIVGIAIVSTPAIEAFGADQRNVWVGYLPFVWLPAVFVTAALLGHLLLFDRLRLARSKPG